MLGTLLGVGAVGMLGVSGRMEGCTYQGGVLPTMMQGCIYREGYTHHGQGGSLPSMYPLTHTEAGRALFSSLSLLHTMEQAGLSSLRCQCYTPKEAGRPLFASL